MSVNIIGISAGSHDSACCLLRNGKLVAAAQEERFSRIKNDRGMPRKAFRYCLEEANISIADVECVAFFEDPVLKFGRQMWMRLAPQIGVELRRSLTRCFARPTTIEELRLVLGWDGAIEIVDHHLSHAASSYYFSGFHDAAILTVDGVGDWATTTYGYGKGAILERTESVEFPHSLGLLYSAVTSYLGFEVNEGEYKIMGLAPYGRPIYADQIRKLIQSEPGAQYRLDLRYFAYLQEERMYSPLMIELLGAPARAPESELTQFHKDVARSVQLVLEEVLLEKVRYLHSQFPSENLCMAGGVALNVVANGRCLREGPFRRLFVQPAAGDAGGALGAAAVAYVRRTGESPGRALDHVYLGPKNSVEEIHELLVETGAQFCDFRNREKELLSFSAEQLSAGKVLAWCHGRCEFGPRALGARSILADPRHPQMRDRINASVKKRESFRPFAPSVLEIEQYRHFDLDHASPFMLETCQVISPLDLPSITHVDGSARVHSVSTRTNPRFAALITEFFRRTGCPILLNTSFNMRDEPIVLTAIDALLCFALSSIDTLILEDFVIERDAVPPLWDFLAQAKSQQRRDVDLVRHLVYTFF
jgi:carbamoyltransferase